MVLTSWSARLLPPHAAADFLARFDSAAVASGLARAPACWFGTRATPDFVMHENVFERAAKQGDDRITLAYAVGAGFSTTTAFAVRLWLESDAGLVSRLQAWTPVLDFNLLAPGTPTKEAGMLERWSDAIAAAFRADNDSPLVEAEQRRTQLTPDQVLEWAAAHIQQSVTNPRLEGMRIMPAGHRNEAKGPVAGDLWVIRYASGAKDNPHMTVVHIEDATAQVSVG